MHGTLQGRRRSRLPIIITREITSGIPKQIPVRTPGLRATDPASRGDRLTCATYTYNSPAVGLLAARPTRRRVTQPGGDTYRIPCRPQRGERARNSISLHHSVPLQYCSTSRNLWKCPNDISTTLFALHKIIIKLYRCRVCTHCGHVQHTRNHKKYDEDFWVK